MKSDLKIIKDEHHWTSEEKLKFCGYGEWVEESDLFEFEYLGYHAIIVRVFKKEPFAKELAYFGGHFCGYVRIPDEHPFFRKQDIDLDCHGGLTFNEAHEEHWVGYDCGHSGDFIPTMEHMRNTNPELKKIKEMFPVPAGFEEFALFNPMYRNIDYCIGECKDMITQLLNVEMTDSIQKGADALKEIEGEVQ